MRTFLALACLLCSFQTIEAYPHFKFVMEMKLGEWGVLGALIFTGVAAVFWLGLGVWTLMTKEPIK